MSEINVFDALFQMIQYGIAAGVILGIMRRVFHMIF